MSIVVGRSDDVTVRGGDVPTVARMRGNIGEGRETRGVVFHRPGPDPQPIVGKIEGLTGRVIEEPDTRCLEVVALSSIDGGLVVDVVVAGQKGDFDRHATEARERLGHEPPGDAREFEQVADYENDIDVVVAGYSTENVDRTDAFVVMEEAVRLACPRPEVDV